jgi:DnaJ-class molecular chaperone
MHLDRLIPGEEDEDLNEPIVPKGCPFCHGTGTLDDSGESTCSKCGGSGLE